MGIMNGGVVAPIVRGYNIDFRNQMESFFKNEFGSVLLSNVKVEFQSISNNDGGDGKISNVEIYGETSRTFPLLANGNELVVRGLLLQSDDTNNEDDNLLQVITSANTRRDGGQRQHWNVTAKRVSSLMSHSNNITEGKGENSLQCFQSYAHSRVTQLLHFRDAAKLMINDDNDDNDDMIIDKLVTLSKPCNNSNSNNLAECIENEALSLALKANLVIMGLTGMVTMDDENCLSNYVSGEETEICRDGTSSYYDYGESTQPKKEMDDIFSQSTSISSNANNINYCNRIICIRLIIIILICIRFFVF